MTVCTATIKTIYNFGFINVRTGPGTHTPTLTTLPVGSAGLEVLDVEPDERRVEFQGKIYQWFQVRLPDGATGWVRDDLVEITGECGEFGYGDLEEAVRPFSMRRVELEIQPIVVLSDPNAKRATATLKGQTSPEPTTPVSVPDPEPAPEPSPSDEDRARTAAFNITSGFEGGGYPAFQVYDAGIISYGRFQFTLAGGSLFAVLERYCQCDLPHAQRLKNEYLSRIQNRDQTLRNDTTLRDLLIAAANDAPMQQAQDAIATEVYWKKAMSLSAEPRNIRSALGRALIFDMGINHGLLHNMIGLAEEALGVPPKSRIPDNGITEEALILQIARIRRDRLHAFADAKNLPGLKPRADFWVKLAESGDWQLKGDAEGFLLIKPGRRVQVWNFA